MKCDAPAGVSDRQRQMNVTMLPKLLLEQLGGRKGKEHVNRNNVRTKSQILKWVIVGEGEPPELLK